MSLCTYSFTKYLCSAHSVCARYRSRYYPLKILIRRWAGVVVVVDGDGKQTMCIIDKEIIRRWYVQCKQKEQEGGWRALPCVIERLCMLFRRRLLHWGSDIWAKVWGVSQGAVWWSTARRRVPGVFDKQPGDPTAGPEAAPDRKGVGKGLVIWGLEASICPHFTLRCGW